MSRNQLLTAGYWLLFFVLTQQVHADCYPFASASDHLGEVACIRGKVVKLVIGPTGLHFLNFCEDYKSCPFTVVVFPRDLRDVGDVRTLEGKEIQITGKVRTYQGQLEIILRDRSQLRGDTAALPNLPKATTPKRRAPSAPELSDHPMVPLTKPKPRKAAANPPSPTTSSTQFFGSPDLRFFGLIQSLLQILKPIERSPPLHAALPDRGHR